MVLKDFPVVELGVVLEVLRVDLLVKALIFLSNYFKILEEVHQVGVVEEVVGLVGLEGLVVLHHPLDKMYISKYQFRLWIWPKAHPHLYLINV